jgi:hypothetical protein
MPKHPTPIFAGPSLAPPSAASRRERPAYAPRLERSYDGWFAGFMRGLSTRRGRTPARRPAGGTVRSKPRTNRTSA